MNQKFIYAKHNKIESCKDLLLNSRNRVKSVFQDISNMNFKFVNLQEKGSRQHKEEKQIQKGKRRNAIIPVNIERMMIKVESAEFQFINIQMKPGNEIEKDILCYFDIVDQKCIKLQIPI